MYLFSWEITWLPRKLYPDCSEKVPGLVACFTDNNDLRGLSLFNPGVPNVAKAIAVIVASVNESRTFRVNDVDMKLFFANVLQM